MVLKAKFVCVCDEGGSLDWPSLRAKTGLGSGGRICLASRWSAPQLNLAMKAACVGEPKSVSESTGLSQVWGFKISLEFSTACSFPWTRPPAYKNESELVVIGSTAKI